MELARISRLLLFSGQFLHSCTFISELGLEFSVRSNDNSFH